MNTKGFTLTELIVTIALIGIISMIAFPAISKLKEDNENEKYKAYEKVMENGAKLHVDSKKRDMWRNNESGKIKIYFDELKQEGLVEPFSDNKTDCTQSYVCVEKTSYGTIHYGTVVICEKNGNKVYNTNEVLKKKKKQSIDC